jgi:hypothetical protein
MSGESSTTGNTKYLLYAVNRNIYVVVVCISDEHGFQ